MVVHQDCHKCKICGVNRNLKLYYEELVCVKHINRLTCRVSDMVLDCKISSFRFVVIVVNYSLKKQDTTAVVKIVTPGNHIEFFHGGRGKARASASSAISNAFVCC